MIACYRDCGGAVAPTYTSLMATWGMMSSPYTGVYAIDPLRDSRWPELIARHPNASVFHTRGWLRRIAGNLWVCTGCVYDLRSK